MTYVCYDYLYNVPITITYYCNIMLYVYIEKSFCHYFNCQVICISVILENLYN